MDECSDPEAEWFPQRSVCYATMSRAAFQAMYAEKHESRPFHDGSFSSHPKAWSEKRSPSHPYRFDEGVTIWPSREDLTPHDHFLGGKRDCADCSGGGAVDEIHDDSGDQEGDGDVDPAG